MAAHSTVASGYFLVHLLVLTYVSAAQDHDTSVSNVNIDPPAYLPGVSRNVQLTCRPPARQDIAEVLMLQLDKSVSGRNTAIATYITSRSPVSENLHLGLNASVSGHYDASQPLSAYLRVDIPEPTADAAGSYLCLVETVDAHGLLRRYGNTDTLTSLEGSVPTFYKKILAEVKVDMGSLADNLTAVPQAHSQITAVSADALTKLSAIDQSASAVSGLMAHVNSRLSEITQRADSLASQTDLLRDMTPELHVHFYAFLSTSSRSPYVNVGENSTVVFNSLDQHSDSSYSTSTGIFTCPYNGTYLFRAALTASYSSNIYSYFSLEAGARVLASAYQFDDAYLKQTTATAVVRLVEGEQVRVVNHRGSTDRIYGYQNINHISYFMGMLLWQ